MSENYQSETEEQRTARWQKLEALTDEEIEAAIADDPDWQGVEVGDAKDWRLVKPNGKTVVPVELDELTMRFFQEHDLSFSGVLNAFAASQTETRD
jgi:hypothetical protein